MVILGERRDGPEKDGRLFDPLVSEDIEKEGKVVMPSLDSEEYAHYFFSL